MNNRKETDRFRIIFDTYHSKIYRFILGYLKNQADAQECTQNVFIHFWKYNHQVNPQLPLDPILFKISKQEIANFYRKRKLACETLDENALSISDSACDETASIYPIDRIYKLLECIPERRLRIFMQSKVHGLSYSQIAKENNISKTAVEKQIVKTIKFIKSNL